jgi:hypothetical protein
MKRSSWRCTTCTSYSSRRKESRRAMHVSGDGTGYSLTISKHYESAARGLKEKAKGDSETPQVNSEEPAKKTRIRVHFQALGSLIMDVHLLRFKLEVREGCI